ncbi:MAG: hypothetical protein WD767_17465 [Alphaproteobacteria bacterium]
MDVNRGIYWIQGQSDGEWRNLQRCADHTDAISKLAPLTGDRRYRELRLVLAQAQRGRIEYKTLVKVRDGEIISGSSLLETLLPTEPLAVSATAPVERNQRWRIAALSVLLVAAIASGVAIAQKYPQLALALYTSFDRETEPTAWTIVPKKETAATGTFEERLFDAVDANDSTAIRRLMATRPGDLRLDELFLYVDDGWGTGPRQIADYALLGSNFAAADALLATGATPSEWLLTLVKRRGDEERLKPAIGLLNEFGLARPLSFNSAISETAREFEGDVPN